MIFKKIYKFLKLTGNEKSLLLSCFLTLVKTSILIEFFPQKCIKSLLGNPVLQEEEIIITGDERETIKKVVKNIRRAIKTIPWKIKCYPHALTGKLLLKKHNIKSYLYIGLCKSASKLKAHAWLKSGDEIIIGKNDYKQYKVINVYY